MFRWDVTVCLVRLQAQQQQYQPAEGDQRFATFLKATKPHQPQPQRDDEQQ